MRQLIIGIDLDDTLIPTARKYHDVTWKCGSIIDTALGVRSPHPKDILDYHEKMDKSNIVIHGYAVERFPLSWAETYRHFADMFEVAVDPLVTAKLLRVAARFMKGPHEPFTGVAEALQQLTDSGHELHLISACQPAEEFQRQKIAETGLASFFADRIHLTPPDKMPAMSRVFIDLSRSVMVGDSKAHDIVPALALGVQAVWVPSTSWSFTQAEVDERTFQTIRAFVELPALLQNSQ